MATMNRYRSPAARFDVSDDDFDARGVLKDGHSFRVPAYLMDSTQRAVQHAVLRDVRVTDAGNGGNRPGYRLQGVEDGSASPSDLLGHQTRLSRAKTYQDYDETVSRAYLGDDVEPDDDDALEKGTPYVGGRENTACMLNGRPGVLRKGRDGQLYCFVGGDTNKADSADSRAEMYRMYDARKAKEYLDPDDADDEDEDDDADDPASRRYGGSAKTMYRETHAYSNRPNRSAPRSDGRTTDAATLSKQHSDRMAKLYDTLDREAEQAWRW